MLVDILYFLQRYFLHPVIAQKIFRDTAGQERFRSLCNSYFRRADGAILVYDCSVERTFLRIRDWIETVRVSLPMHPFFHTPH